MKKLLLFGLMVFCIYKVWGHFGPGQSIEPLFAEPYVAVYGRATCGYTTSALRELKNSGVNYKVFDIDDRDTANILHARMEQSGISTRRYNLPVIDVNGSIMVRPEIEDVLLKYED